jgi:carbamoyltransferase
MEFGPRALGARSILADPRGRYTRELLNAKIKFRETFRPFAPCVLAEHARTYFDLPEGMSSPYMLFTAPVAEGQRLPCYRAELRQGDALERLQVPRSTIPAVTHVDASARVQTVDEKRHGRFWRLLRAFYRRTGCPVLVNTSFNVRGEPIVCTPAEAYRCFVHTDLDALVLENHLLLKREQSPVPAPRRKAYRTEFAPD